MAETNPAEETEPEALAALRIVQFSSIESGFFRIEAEMVSIDLNKA